jgi:hypothetical protein
MEVATLELGAAISTRQTLSLVPPGVVRELQILPFLPRRRSYLPLKWSALPCADDTSWVWNVSSHGPSDGSKLREYELIDRISRLSSSWECPHVSACGMCSLSGAFEARPMSPLMTTRNRFSGLPPDLTTFGASTRPEPAGCREPDLETSVAAPDIAVPYQTLRTEAARPLKDTGSPHAKSRMWR